MGHMVEYIISVDWKEIVDKISAPISSKILEFIKQGRTVAYESSFQQSSTEIILNISPVASQITLPMKWTPVFMADYSDPNDIQWQKAKRQEVHEFESLLKAYFSRRPIVRVDELLINDWSAYISEREAIVEDGDDEGWSCYCWLCEQKYVEEFFIWLEENHKLEEPEDPEVYKGWIRVQ